MVPALQDSIRLVRETGAVICPNLLNRMQNDEGWLTHLFAGVESQSEIPSANHLHLKGKAKAVTPSLIYYYRNLQNYKERIHIMEGRLIAFVIWVIIGVLFIVMGIYDFNSKKAKPFGFWANAEVAPIEDVKGYNRALGILWCVYGVLFTLIGLPLLDGQNSGLIIIPILGAMLISIAAMVAYVVGIEPKYRKKK